MAKSSGSRVFHGIMIVPCVLLCIISIVSFSTFTAKHNQITKDSRDNGYITKDHCILFSTTEEHDGETYIDLGSLGPCLFSIWGQVGVCLASVVLGVWFLLKLLVGFHMLTCLLLFELAFIILTGLLDFVVAIVITAGLNKTCGSFGTTISTCEHDAVKFKNTGKVIDYYPNINASKATAWIGTAILIILATIYMVFICFYCRRRRRQNSPQEPPSYDPLKNEENNVDEKPVPV